MPRGNNNCIHPLGSQGKMREMRDLTWQVFGTIKVLGFAGVDKHREYHWNCICLKCGRIMNKTTRGCKKKGCRVCVKIKTGESKTRLWQIWNDLIGRCLNKKIKGFNNYGGRGIKVCNELLDYDNFKKWAIKSGYKDKLEIDRINVNGNYCPENCRWANERKQANNKRNNLFFEIKGEKKTLAELVRIYNINYYTALKRLRRGVIAKT